MDELVRKKKAKGKAVLKNDEAEKVEFVPSMARVSGSEVRYSEPTALVTEPEAEKETEDVAEPDAEIEEVATTVGEAIDEAKPVEISKPKPSERDKAINAVISALKVSTVRAIYQRYKEDGVLKIGDVPILD